MEVDSRTADKSALNRVAVIALWVILVGSSVFILLTLYGRGPDFAIAGVRVKSTHLFRPTVVALVSWLALGWLRPRLRPNRDLILIVACFALYAYTYHLPYSHDVYPSEYTAFSIATGRGTSLNDYQELLAGGVPYYITETPFGLRSNYPLGPALLAWPLFVPAPLAEIPRPELVHLLATTAAILVALAAVWLVLGIARKLDPPFSPYLVALAYALGTTHWSTSAAALWQHGPGEVWVLGAFDRLLDGETPLTRRLLALGACMTLAVFTRPSLAISAVLVALLTIHRYRRKALIAFTGAAVLALPLLAYHLQTYGSILGAYVSQRGTLSAQPLSVWSDAVFWILASPSRGVLWYEPAVMLTLAVALLRLPRSKTVYLPAGLGGFALTLFLYGHWPAWWGGYSYGPRLMTDALPWWVLALASMGKAGPWLRNATVGLTIWGALVNVVGSGNPVFWDDRPPVNWFPDRLKSLGDSQLVTAFLVSGLGDRATREAARADAHHEDERALDLWREEWKRRPWHRFAAFRVADLLMRTDRLEEARKHMEVMQDRWPDSSYVGHLHRLVPRIVRMLGNPTFRKPDGARASPNPESVSRIYDSLLSTHWSTERPQRAGDWLELRSPPGELVRGVAVFSVPEFGHGPAGFEVYGTTTSGRIRFLGQLKRIKMPRKGWHVIRFDPVRLESLRIRIARKQSHPWTVSEARLITVDETR